MQKSWRLTAWERWKIINHAVGHLHSQAITVFFYFTVLVPFGIAVRFLSDPLNTKTLAPAWHKREEVKHSLEDARRQA